MPSLHTAYKPSQIIIVKDVVKLTRFGLFWHFLHTFIGKFLAGIGIGIIQQNKKITHLFV